MIHTQSDSCLPCVGDSVSANSFGILLIKIRDWNEGTGTYI